jgi:hypothetical protein
MSNCIILIGYRSIFTTSGLRKNVIASLHISFWFTDHLVEIREKSVQNLKFVAS